MNCFSEDLQYSLDVTRNEEFNNFYEDIWSNLLGIETIDYQTHKEEQLQGMDKRIYLDNGRVFTIDEKIRRKDYGDIFLELESNIRRAKPGWFFTSICDYIVYYIEPTRKVYLLPMDFLRMAYREHGEEWLKQYRTVTAPNESGYYSKGLCVPAEVILEAIKEQMAKNY